MLGALLAGVSSRSSALASTTTTCRTAARSFCAWDPKWKRKVRKHKLTKAKAEEKKREKLQGSILRKPRKPKFKMPVIDQEAIGISAPDNLSLEGAGGLEALSMIQGFSATSSPFVYTASLPEEEPPTEQEEYWNPNRAAAVQRNVAKWIPFQPKDFGFDVPQTDHIAEVAFLGRSNVGKSSLMNSLMGAKLARTSKQPGRTQLVNYYGMMTAHAEKSRKIPDWRKCSGFIVDLPGYGFAVGPDKAVGDWQDRTQDWLLDRTESGNLRRLYLLVDSRHELQNMDKTVLEWLDQMAVNLPYTVVLTKADAVRGGPRGMSSLINSISLRYQHSTYQEAVLRGEVEEEPVDHAGLLEMREGMGVLQSPIIHVTSSSKGLGLNELWKSVCYELKQGPRQTEKVWGA